MSAYPLDSIAFAEHLLEIADTHGTATALLALGENWARLDTVAPVTPLLRRWAKEYTLSNLRGLLMSEVDRYAEAQYRLSRKPLRVYRAGHVPESASFGLVWHRRRRDAVAHARVVGAGFIATGLLAPQAYAAAKYIGRGGVEFLVLPEAAPTVQLLDVVGGQTNG